MYEGNPRLPTQAYELARDTWDYQERRMRARVAAEVAGRWPYAAGASLDSSYIIVQRDHRIVWC